MWDAIKSDQNNFVKSDDEGVAKVNNSTATRGYAYLMESSSLDYITARNCDLTGIGNPLDDTKGYGVAFPKSKTTEQPLHFDCSIKMLCVCRSFGGLYFLHTSAL